MRARAPTHTGPSIVTPSPITALGSTPGARDPEWRTFRAARRNSPGDTRRRADVAPIRAARVEAVERRAGRLQLGKDLFAEVVERGRPEYGRRSPVRRRRCRYWRVCCVPCPSPASLETRRFYRARRASRRRTGRPPRTRPARWSQSHRARDETRATRSSGRSVRSSQPTTTNVSLPKNASIRFTAPALPSSSGSYKYSRRTPKRDPSPSARRSHRPGSAS